MTEPATNVTSNINVVLLVLCSILGTVIYMQHQSKECKCQPVTVTVPREVPDTRNTTRQIGQPATAPVGRPE